MTRDYEVGFYDDGSRIVGPRPTEAGEFSPYTAEENAAADARLAAAVVADTLRSQVAAQITVLLASIDALKVISDKANADIGPRDTKDVARECRTVARTTVRMARLLGGVLDSTDSGA